MCTHMLDYLYRIISWMLHKKLITQVTCKEMGSNHGFTPYYLFSSYPLVIEPQSITNLMADLNKNDICQFSLQTGGQCCVLQKGAMLSSPPHFPPASQTVDLLPETQVSYLEHKRKAPFWQEQSNQKELRPLLVVASSQQPWTASLRTLFTWERKKLLS